MHLPSNGLLNGLIGEELLEWLNTSFIAPDSEEAIELSKLSTPWKEDRFWHYLIRWVSPHLIIICSDYPRCVLRGLSRTALIFFEGLKKHPSPLMGKQAETLINILSSHPRSTNFDTEQEFFYAWRQWKTKAAGFRKQLELISDEDGEDWLPWLLEIAHIMEGDKDTIIRYCESYEEGWKEAVCVWGVWVDVGLRRQTLP
jgi:nuclear pore complex protein Nup85